MTTSAPFGNAGDCCSPNYDTTVDQLLGNAYQVVKFVAMRMPFIKSLSDNIDDLIALAGSLENLNELAADLPQLMQLQAELQKLLALYTNLSDLVQVADNLPQLLLVHDNLPQIQIVVDNLTQIQTVVTNIASIVSVASNIAAVNNVNANMSALLNVNTNMAVVTNVSTNMTDVRAVANNMPQVQAVSANMAELLAIYAQLDDLAQIATDLQETLAKFTLLAGVDGASMVGYQLDAIGSTLTNQEQKNAERVSPRDFGGVGNGTADDSDAIEKMINMVILTGAVGDFLDQRFNWRMSRPLTFTTSNKVIRLAGSGAKITADFATHALSVLHFKMVGGKFSSVGEYEINASQQSNMGLFVINEQAYDDVNLARPDVFISDLGVINCKRINSTYLESASGIQIQGAMGDIQVIRPRVKNTVLGATAGVSGSYGAFSLSILNLSAAGFKSVLVQDPQFDTVKCEDPSYTVDQDHLRIFDGGERSFRLYPWDSFVEVVGGVYRNAYGRSIKIQAQLATVRGTNHYRDEGFALGVGNPEVDIQTGGCDVDGVTGMYVNFVPSQMVQLSSARVNGRLTPGMSVRNVKAVITGSRVMQRIVAHTQFVDEATQVHMKNLSVIGGVEYLARLDCRAAGTRFYMEDVSGAPTLGAVQAVNSGASASECSLLASNVSYTGIDQNTKAFVIRGAATALLRTSAASSPGWLRQRRISTGDPGSFPAVERSFGIAAANQMNSGLITPLNYTLAGGAQQVLPVIGYNGVPALMFLSIAHTKESQGIFSIGADGVTPVTGIGSAIVTGTTAEPATGDYRVWYDAAAGGIVIKNNRAEERNFFVVLIG